MKFWLGTHMPSWLNTATVPLFVSHRRLGRTRKLPRASCEWALDSGGFTELSMFGEWRTTPLQYATAVRRYRDEVGQLAWAAPMDWMCEPFMLAKTGLSVHEHQHRTVANFLWLRSQASDLPFVPVLQGQTTDDYLRHADAYYRSGIELRDEPLVGVGSVCRRQASAEIESLLVRLAALGLKLHGFGVKTSGLARYSHALASADSMAWSYRGRRVHPGCTPSHQSEANCLRFALEWRDRVLDRSEADQQIAMAL